MFEINIVEVNHFLPETLPDYYNSGYPKLRIGLCQVYTEPWSVQKNFENTIAAIDLAADLGAEIAVTPECVINGYPVNEKNNSSPEFMKRIRETAESRDGEHLKVLREKARQKNIYILIGFAERESELVYNSAALISPGGQYVYIYRKVHCRHFESIEHNGFFVPGNDFYSMPLKFREGTFMTGTIICFDREIPESFRCMRALGSELVLCPLATDTVNMRNSENIADNEIITRVGSAGNELFTVVVNHSGRFNGGSFITGPMGELLCQMNSKPGVLVYDIPAGVLSQKFHNNPLGWMGWGYRRPDVYSKYQDR